MNFVNAFAIEGYRTLLLTKKDISETEYALWNEQFLTASMSLSNREELVC